MKQTFTFLSLLFFVALSLGLSTSLQAQEFSMEANGYVFVESCGGAIYDSGGPNQPYSANENSIMVIDPEGDSPISLFFFEFDVEGVNIDGECFLDRLEIFDGPDTLSPMISPWIFDSLNVEPAWCYSQGSGQGSWDLTEMIITSSGGAITLRFISDGTQNLQGFSAEFSCSDPQGSPPVAGFDVNAANNCGLVNFYDFSFPSPTSWYWDFGNGLSATSPFPSFIYDESGTYAVSLTVCNGFGCDSTFMDIDVFVDPNDPLCDVYLTPTSGTLLIEECAGLLYDSGGPGGDYSNNENGIVVIDPPGEDVISIVFTEFVLENTNLEGCFDQLILYDGNSINAPIIPSPGTGADGWCWDDDQAGSGNLVGQTIFGSNGALTIQFLTDGSVTRAGFAAEFSCTDLDVPPVTNFGFTQENFCDDEVSFTDLSYYAPNSWAWDFGDGNASTQQNPTHTYTEGGIYFVTLETCNDFGCTSFTTSDTIHYDPDNFACTVEWMPISGTDTLTNCEGTISDSGGPFEEYSNDESGILVIEGADDALLILTFLEMDIETNFDQLIIYDGEMLEENILFTVDDGVTIPNAGEPIYSQYNRFIIQFTSDFSVTRPGWLAEYICVPVERAIQAFCYNDENENGQYDTGENSLLNQNLNLDPGAFWTTTNSEGYSTYYIDEDGSYTLSLVDIPGLWELSSATDMYTIDITGDTVVEKSFGLHAVADVTILDGDLVSAPTRCNSQVNYWLTYENKGTTNATGVVELTPDDLTTFVTSNPAPDLIQGGTLYWNYSDLAPSHQNQIVLAFDMPDENFIGEILYSEGFVHSLEGIDTTFSKKFIHSSEVACSFDPNDKLVEQGVGDANYTLFEETLEYTIRFQNTGNDVAFDVVILDTLDANLIPTTLEIIASSHPVEYLLKKDEGIAEFAFPNIYLPDSTSNEPESHGFVKFRISTVEGLEEFTEVSNTAHIYFDSNPAVVTNTITNTFVSEIPTGILSIGEKENTLQVAPNPSSGMVTLNVDRFIEGEVQIQILDLSGKLVQQLRDVQLTNQSPQNLNLNDLENGVYFIQVQWAEEMMTEKIIIQR